MDRSALHVYLVSHLRVSATVALLNQYRAFPQTFHHPDRDCFFRYRLDKEQMVDFDVVAIGFDNTNSRRNRSLTRLPGRRPCKPVIGVNAVRSFVCLVRTFTHHLESKSI